MPTLRVLNRGRWSGVALSRTLLKLLVAAFVPDGPLILGIDETIERRRGTTIAAKGIERDPVRSSHGHFIKASGLHWVSLMLLVPIPWAVRTWALPFLTALAPSERWSHPVTVVTRLRLDAELSEPAPPRHPRQRGRAAKDRACRPWRLSPPIHRPAGRCSPWPPGMATVSAASRSCRDRPSDITPGCRPCHCAGCWSAPHRGGSTHKPCSAPTARSRPIRS